MRITADTNVLVRAATGDDSVQSAAAKRVLATADVVAIPLAALCELAWVLSQGYKISTSDLAQIIRRLAGSGSVALNRPAVDAGLTMLEAGGDFADGVIAFEGNLLGGETFASFDKKAVKLAAAQGWSAMIPQ